MPLLPTYPDPKDRHIKTVDYDIPSDLVAHLGEDEDLEIDLSKVTPGARPGLPWRSGRLYLEHKASLRLNGRGLGSNPGEYFKLRAMPQVQAALSDLRCAVLSSPLIIESTAVPPWLEDDEEAKVALEVQRAFIDRVWWKWTRAGEARGLNDWISDVLLFAPVCGFYLGEMIGESVTWDIGKGSLEYLCPFLPELRAPWTVREWILQNEEPVAVVQTLFQSQDNARGAGGGQPSEVVIPWNRIVHIPFEPAGPSDLEGRSILRGAEVALKILMDVYRLQALAIEVNGLGTVIITKETDTAPDMTEDARDKLESHLKNYKASHVPYLILPSGYKATWASPQSTVPDLSAQVGIYERMVELALNQTHKGIATRNTGAFAARSDASADSRASIDAHARELICKPLERLMATFLRLNFPQWAEKDWIFTPRITPQPHDARDLGAEASALAALTSAGHIPQHEDITKALLERYGLPLDFIDTLPEEEALGIAPIELLRQGRLLGEALYLEEEQSNFFRSMIGMSPWTKEARDEYITGRNLLSATPEEASFEMAEARPIEDIDPDDDAETIGDLLEDAVDEVLGGRIEEMVNLQSAHPEPKAFINAYRSAHPLDSESVDISAVMTPIFETLDIDLDEEIKATAIEAGARALMTTYKSFAADIERTWREDE